MGLLEVQGGVPRLYGGWKEALLGFMEIAEGFIGVSQGCWGLLGLIGVYGCAEGFYQGLWVCSGVSSGFMGDAEGF